MEYKEYKPSPDTKPSKMVMLLHGYGANGDDLIDLAPVMVPHLKEEVVFISPDAPHPCEMAPTGRQWYSLADRSQEAMTKGAKEVRPELDKFIDEQLDRFSLSDSDLVLAGFSQGAMMSLYAGLRRKDKIAGVLSYSGWLSLSEDPSSLNKIPVHLEHGEADDVVPFQAWQDAMAKLKEADFDVTGQSHSFLTHGINESGVQGGIKFLKKIGL